MTQIDNYAEQALVDRADSLEKELNYWKVMYQEADTLLKSKGILGVSAEDAFKRAYAAGKRAPIEDLDDSTKEEVTKRAKEYFHPESAASMEAWWDSADKDGKCIPYSEFMESYWTAKKAQIATNSAEKLP